VTYTVTLSNSGDLSAAVRITDVLGAYYTAYNALDFSQPTTSTLTWNGIVPAGQSVDLKFVARVTSDMTKLKIGQNLLNNSVTIDDGVNAPFAVNAPNAPWVQIYGLYMPVGAKQ